MHTMGAEVSILEITVRLKLYNVLTVKRFDIKNHIAVRNRIKVERKSSGLVGDFESSWKS